MTASGELGLFALDAAEPSIGIGGTDVGLVDAPVPVNGDVGVMAAAFPDSVISIAALALVPEAL